MKESRRYLETGGLKFCLACAVEMPARRRSTNSGPSSGQKECIQKQENDKKKIYVELRGGEMFGPVMSSSNPIFTL